MTIERFLSEAWSRYVHLTPDATAIHELFKARGELIVNDHLAFRTFNLQGISRLEVGAAFENYGYQKANEDLDFPEKKLKASYYLHPSGALPKIFISELLVEKFSNDLQSWIKHLTQQKLQTPPQAKTQSLEQFLQPSWDPIRFEDYERFYSESEYAAWTAAFGIQVNHFTLLVNSLKSFPSIQVLNDFLISHGILLNKAGGAIKGTPKELLEQSSTQAKKVEWKFAGAEQHAIMGCYYEFARRYPLPDKVEYFSGFIPKSADKIFESNFESTTK